MSEFDCGKSKKLVKGEYKSACAYNNDDRSTMQPAQLEPSLTDLILNPKSKRIVRPPNAFMLFARDHRKSLAMKNPTQNNKNISSLLGECWRNVDEATRSGYYKKAKMLEELHKQKYPGYVYSPRIARMQKLARKKKTLDKCGDNNMPNANNIKLEPTEPGNTGNVGSERCGEGNDGSSEKKQSSPGYIPNNPQYFSDPVKGPQPEMPCTLKSSTQGYVYPGCPPPPWNMPPVESTAMSSAGRCPDECSARSDMHAESYYPKCNQPEMYDYGPWHQHPNYPYEFPISAPWSTCVSGCQGECSIVHSNDEHSSYLHLPPSQVDLNSHYHFNSSEPYRKYPYSCSYVPYRESPIPYRPRHCVPYKITPPKASSAYFHQSMDYYHNEYQHHFKDYYPKFPYPTQPIDYPPIQEIIYSTEYPPEIHGSRMAHAEERTESNIMVQGEDSLQRGVEQVNTESDGSGIIDVVGEEVVVSENTELEQAVQNVIAM